MTTGYQTPGNGRPAPNRRQFSKSAILQFRYSVVPSHALSVEDSSNSSESTRLNLRTLSDQQLFTKTTISQPYPFQAPVFRSHIPSRQYPLTSTFKPSDNSAEPNIEQTHIPTLSTHHESTEPYPPQIMIPSDSSSPTQPWPGKPKRSRRPRRARPSKRTSTTPTCQSMRSSPCFYS